MIGRFAHVAAVLLVAHLTQPAQPSQPNQPNQPSSDLDEFMSRVLARRDDNWRKLQQYVLDEREQATLLGPGRVRLYGLQRDYVWYIRDGVFVRSPVAFDGVKLSEEERRKYEDEWLAREKAREDKSAKAAPDDTPPATPDVDALVRLAKEPRFVSAAYFLKFKFESGRYAFAGPEDYQGRRVLKIEYYPSRLFADDKSDGSGEKSDADNQQRSKEDRDSDQRIEQQLNKVSLITLWIEPDSHQIVKYVFDNVGLDFLPGRWLVRVDDMRATMEMGQPFAGVWLPRQIDFHGAMTLANGTYDVQYLVAYRDYREATTKAKVR